MLEVIMRTLLAQRMGPAPVSNTSDYRRRDLFLGSQLCSIGQCVYSVSRSGALDLNGYRRSFGFVFMLFWFKNSRCINLLSM